MFGLLTTLTSPNLALPSMAPRFKIGLKLGFILCSALLLNACDDSQSDANQPTGQTSDQQASVDRTFPEPPPPVTSTTQILSGGWLLSGDGSDPQFDSIVVIRDGLIVGVGKRGTVDVPADSVGVDASGKWILPGTTAQLSAAFGQRNHDAPTQFATTQMPAIEVGRSAELVLLNSNPLTDPQALDDVHAIVSNGQVEVLKSNPS
jgi:hypothetical protein